MKTVDPKSLIIGVLLTMLVVAFMLGATTNSTPAWEYKHFSSVGLGNDPALNKLGEEGWELVGYTFSTGQGNDYHHYVLKRARRFHWKWTFWK